MKTLSIHASKPCIFSSRVRAIWEAMTTLAGIPVATDMRDERLKAIVSHLKRDAAVTGNVHLADVADRLEKIRKVTCR